LLRQSRNCSITRRWRATIAALLRGTAIAALLRGTAIAALLRGTAIAALLRWTTVAGLLRWAAVTTLLRAAVASLGTAVTSLWATIAAWTTLRRTGSIALLILGVVRAVDTTQQQLDEPELRSEIDRWIGALHLIGFDFVVYISVSMGGAREKFVKTYWKCNQ
jgi:hypothetical protein